MTYSEVAASYETQKKANIAKIVLSSSALRVSQFNLWEGPFTVKNTGPLAVKDLRITCEFYGKSGTKLDERSVKVFETFPPGAERKTQRITVGIISSQASQFSCAISDLDYDLSSFGKRSPNKG